MNRELEDIFRNGLENAGSKPSPQTWSHIKNRLWWNDITTILSSGTVKPSSAVWSSIVLSLWFRNFIRFSAGTFNIYYLGFAVAFITSTIALTNGIQEKNALTADMNSPRLIKFNHAGSNSGNLPPVKETVSAITTVPANPAQVNNSSSFTNNAVPSFTTSEPQVQQYAGQSPDVNIETAIRNPVQYHLDMIPVLNPASFDTEKPLYSITGNDSIFDWTGKPVTVERYRLSADIFVSFANVNNRFTASPDRDDFITDPKIKLGALVSGGIGINYQWNHFSVQGGLAYSSMNQVSNFKTLHYSTDTTIISWLLDGGHYSYDTLWVLNLDSLINGNPVYVAVIDSYYVHTTDTMSVEKPITTKQIEEERAYAKVSYVEVPLSAGYTVSSGRFDYRLKVSFIPGMLTYTKGNMINPFAEFGDIAVQKQTYKQWLFSGGTSLEIIYNPAPRIGISLEPFYRHNLNSLFASNMPFELKTNSWGCKFSLRYYIK